VEKEILNSSLRDPGGFLYYKNGVLYRQINKTYREEYDYFISSGLYDRLIKEKLLIFHTEEDICNAFNVDSAYKIIRPKIVSFISYPYEWCFSALKDAGLLVLKIEKLALQYGMTLKDATAYNVQFVEGKPIFIDTLSFKRYLKGEPWMAYRQFCENFLGPLALASFKSPQLIKLLRLYVNDVPLRLFSDLLPVRTFWRFGLLVHIHLHAKATSYFSNAIRNVTYSMKLSALMRILDSLSSTMKNIRLKSGDDLWLNYYMTSSYSTQEMAEKKETVFRFLKIVNPRTIWDIGGNIGIFSRLFDSQDVSIISFDNDHACIEYSYAIMKEKNEKNILPLVMDIMNPSPSVGWENRERLSFKERGPVDVVLIIAFVHHLVVYYNVPIEKIACFLSEIGNSIIIEFVSKDDQQFEKLASTRKDSFADYNQDYFELVFSRYFIIKERRYLSGSQRVLYLMIKK